jgi:CRP-like cAMP-binding protein
MLHSELLAQIPLFDTLAAEDLEALAGRMTERHYKASEKVFDKNDQGSSMYIVLSGGGAG